MKHEKFSLVGKWLCQTLFFLTPVRAFHSPSRANGFR